MPKPLALIISDEFDSKELLWSLVQECQQADFIVKVCPPQFLAEYIAELREAPTEPVLYFADPNLRYHGPRGPNLKAIQEFHRGSPDFPMCFSADGHIVSFNPRKVEVIKGRLCPQNHLNFYSNNLAARRLIPPVEPVSIIFRAHSRSTYAQLALNSLVHSIGARMSQVYFLLALSQPSPEIEAMARTFIAKYPHCDAIKIEPNSYLGTGKYAVLWAQQQGKTMEKLLLCEDDFILPGSVRDIFPDWPWLFSQRLKSFDLVCWSPSTENLPTVYHKLVPTVQKSAVTMNLQVNRQHLPGTKWINSFNNYNMFTCGNAIGMNLAFYKLCLDNRQLGYSIDQDYNSLRVSTSMPYLHGYHIGWNQEQDGYGSLLSSRWKKPPEQVDISDLKTGRRSQHKLSDPILS